MRSKNILLAALFLVLAVTGLVPGCEMRIEDQPMVPLYGVDNPNVVPDDYVIVLPGTSDGPVERTMQQAESLGARIVHQYRYALKGFSAHVPPAALRHLRRSRDIAYIQANVRGQITGVQTCPPSWGLDRINQASLPLDGVYTYDATGIVPDPAKLNDQPVEVYVVDTGIRKNHEVFGGATSRVVGGACTMHPAPPCPDPAPEGTDPSDFLTQAEWEWTDYHGHGTHVAGIVGGAAATTSGKDQNEMDVGVAKGVRFYSVRVAESDSPAPQSNDTIDALEWIKHHRAAMESKKQPGEVLPKAVVVIGVSFFEQNLAIAEGVEALIDADVVVVASAGNNIGQGATPGERDACNYSPGGAYDQWNGGPAKRRLLAVGASNDQDQQWLQSNVGTCVDLNAPGVEIMSATVKGCTLPLPGDPNNDLASPCQELDLMSGTSQAAAHVAGVAAILRGKNPGLSAVEIINLVLNDASTGPIGLMLWSRNVVGSPDPDMTPDDGCDDVVKGCAGGSCNFCPVGPRCCNQKPDVLDSDCGEKGLRCDNGKCDVCGGEGEECCLGPKCGSALECKAGVCTCGWLGEICCEGDVCHEYECDVEGKCGECGDKDDPCCAGSAASACDFPFKCDDMTKKCVSGGCGDKDEKCCPGSLCAGPYECDLNYKCGQCGDYTEKCCLGDWCDKDFECNSMGTCGDCGGQTEPCCGLDCEYGLACISGTCELPQCGKSGQSCCGLDCEDWNTCTSGTCEPCGKSYQACCLGSPQCEGSLSCVDGQCKQCGGPEQDCCDDYECDGDMACVGGKCKGYCETRCLFGANLKAMEPKTTKAECAFWAFEACTVGEPYFGPSVQPKYNHLPVPPNIDNCGEPKEACCIAVKECVHGECHHNDGPPDGRLDFPKVPNPMGGLELPDKPGVILKGYSACPCGKKNQPCCHGKNDADTCEMGLSCQDDHTCKQP